MHLTRLSNLIDLPEFVKQADITAEQDVSELPRSSFADIIDRKFPIHNKVSSFLSYAYFLRQRDDIEKNAASRLDGAFKSAASMWNLKAEFMCLRRDLAKKAAAPAPATVYALTANGTPFFPVDTPANLQKSADSLIENRGKFPYPMRKEAATNMLKAGLRMSIPTRIMPEEIHRMAGMGICSKEAVQHELDRRVGLVDAKQREAAEPIQKLAFQLDALGQPDNTMLQKIAAIIDVFDRSVGLTKLYGTALPYPEDTLFSWTEKTANEIRDDCVTMITGTTYSLRELSEKMSAFGVLGNEFVEELSLVDGTLDLHKAADILPTLPRPDAATLDRALDVAGIKQASFSLTVNAKSPDWDIINQSLKSKDNLTEQEKTARDALVSVLRRAGEKAVTAKAAPQVSSILED